MPVPSTLRVFRRLLAVGVSALAVGNGAIALASPADTAASDGTGRSVVTEPTHFVFFGLDRQRIREATFLETSALVGAQLKYTWRELEPARGGYDFDGVLQDLAFLEKHGKRLFVQLQDVSFSERLNVPQYLVEDPAFGGGVARKLDSRGEANELVFDGWVARRWDPAVLARFSRLLEALGNQLDGRIEGLNLAETSIGFGDDPKRHPLGFTYESYAAGMKSMLSAATEAFPRSKILAYANFMPGEWLPWEDNGYLRGIYQHAESIGAGVGGPDLMPHRKGQQNHCLKLIGARSSGVVAGLAVQDGNLAQTNPSTGRPITADELLAFAQQSLRLNYLFWGAEEPYYTEQILPLLQKQAPRPR